MKYVAPSLLAADFTTLRTEIEMINQSEAQWLHIDVMDGVFVPNISFGTPIIEAIAPHCDKFLDVHLMIIQPERYFKTYQKAGAELLTIHYETSTHLHRNIEQIKNLGMKAGVALNPHTNIGLLEDCLDMLDIVLIMSVNPGFGGQKFIENTYQKIMNLKDLILKKNATTLIEVDGGVNTENAAKLYQSGADILVAGNAIFKAEDPLNAIKNLINKGII